jgi:hypothetical protein
MRKRRGQRYKMMRVSDRATFFSREESYMVTGKEKFPPLLRPEVAERNWSARESCQLFGIMAEFVEATERLQHVSPTVSIFGSAWKRLQSLREPRLRAFAARARNAAQSAGKTCCRRAPTGR